MQQKAKTGAGQGVVIIRGVFITPVIVEDNAGRTPTIAWHPFDPRDGPWYPYHVTLLAL
jgi:hypothetical protein